MSLKPDLSDAKGYNIDFLDHEKVDLPEISDELKSLLISLKKKPAEVELKYENYSLVMHKERKFAIYTASNIDGKRFQAIPRKEIWPDNDKWYKDNRIRYKEQWGNGFYKSEKSDFDRGHLVKREDAQWGDTKDDAVTGARNTFFYTNAAPQHANLNQGIWRELEDYILHSETKENSLKVCVFTGPVLRDKDPFFVTEVKGKKIKLPTLFWKVVYYVDHNDELKRVAFLIGQEKLLVEDGIVEEPVDSDLEVIEAVDELFTDFEDAETYQVNIKTVERLTQLKFPHATEPYTDDRNLKQIIKKVQSELESFNESGDPSYELLGIQL